MSDEIPLPDEPTNEQAAPEPFTATEPVTAPVQAVVPPPPPPGAPTTPPVFEAAETRAPKASRRPSAAVLATAGVSLAVGVLVGVAGAEITNHGGPGRNDASPATQPDQQAPDGQQGTRPSWGAGQPPGHGQGRTGTQQNGRTGTNDSASNGQSGGS